MVIFKIERTELKRCLSGRKAVCECTSEPEKIDFELLDKALLEIMLENREAPEAKENVA